MGYELHVTRAEEWSRSAERPITEEEWLSVVAADPELRIDEANGPHFAVWSDARSKSELGWFDWDDGCVSTKSPNRQVLKKALELAARLGAAVQGDEGEVYDHPSQISEDPYAEVAAFERRQRVLLVIFGILFSLGVAAIIYRLYGWIARMGSD